MSLPWSVRYTRKALHSYLNHSSAFSFHDVCSVSPLSPSSPYFFLLGSVKEWSKKPNDKSKQTPKTNTPPKKSKHTHEKTQQKSANLAELSTEVSKKPFIILKVFHSSQTKKKIGNSCFQLIDRTMLWKRENFCTTFAMTPEGCFRLSIATKLRDCPLSLFIVNPVGGFFICFWYC